MAASMPQTFGAESAVLVAVQLDDPKNQKPGRTNEDVAKLRPSRGSETLGPLQGQWDRDPDDEQEEREDDIGQGHPVGTGRLDVVHPGRCPVAKVVDKDHQQDGQPAQGVHGDHARTRPRLAGTCRTFAMDLCQGGFHRGVVFPSQAQSTVSPGSGPAAVGSIDTAYQDTHLRTILAAETHGGED